MSWSVKSSYKTINKYEVYETRKSNEHQKSDRQMETDMLTQDYSSE